MKKIMRKIILTLMLLTGTVSMLNAQDLIILTNGKEIQTTVLEIGDTYIKYKLYSNLSGPTYTVHKSQVFMIKYGREFPELPELPEPPEPPEPPVENAKKFRKGCIGIAIGMFEEDMGGEFQNSLNFSYRFGRHVGITSSIFITTYLYMFDIKAEYAGWMLGPLFTAANSSKTVEYDLKPTVGMLSGMFVKKKLIVGLGASVRWNCTNRISLSGNIDYYNIHAIGMTTGLNFRF
jgi:hypothetical protein